MNVPVQLTSFIGRERELAEVQQLLATARLVTLSGSGGCGKTRLALQIANQMGNRFPDGVWMVDLAPLRDPALIPQLVAQTFDLRPVLGQPIFKVLLDFVKPKQLLLILDNCEHLIDPCAQFTYQLLSQAAKLCILATSREPLAIEGEAVYPLVGLAYPPLTVEPPLNGTNDSDLQALMQYDAVRLFTERARAISHKFTITTENMPMLIEICRRLDGIPLALELASVRTTVLTVQQIAARLDDHMTLFTAGQRVASTPHHNTLRAAIDWSYDLLSVSEQTALQRLSLFTTSFTLSTSEDVCGWGSIQRNAVLGLLSALVAKSMIVVETLQGNEARYRLLETIRQYGQEKLSVSIEWVTAHDHYLASYVRLTEEISPKLREQYQQLWLSWLETENDNIRTALSWAVEQGRIEEGLRIGTALFAFWQMRGYAREGCVWFERLLQQADDNVTLAARVNGLTWLSVLAAMAGDMQASTACGQAALALCNRAGEEGQHLLKIALIGAATGARSAGDYVTTYALGSQIIALYRELGDKKSVGTGALVTGQIATMLGKYAEAHDLLDESLALAREATDVVLIAMALSALGDLARCEERFAQATTWYEESLPAFRTVGATHELAVAQHGLAYALLHQGNVTRAHLLFTESLAVMRVQEDHDGLLKGVMGFAALAAVAGLAQESARLYGAATANEGDKTATRWPPEKLEYDYYFGQVQATLNNEEFAIAQERGRAMSIEQAIDAAFNLPQSLGAPPVAKSTLTAQLTEREHEVVALIALGKSNGEIAGDLVLSKRTVEKHVANILAKLELTSRAQIIRWAFDHTPTTPSTP